ncbi:MULTISPECIES: alpha/beta hydrolase [unclassified Roseitalea]|uniref:alpha/beta fold hydrolase n=1 Tax=unclassified Roseitalea TaxID=2639107 RepID=UPI00273DB8D8|nr:MULTISPECIES: alpha/beta hydrolase [unclassified Roseitalea]
MNIALAALAVLASLAFALAGATRIGVFLVERRYPPTGTFATVRDTRLHFVLHRAERPDLPTTVFLHGASGNLHDAASVFAEPLRGRANLLFVDRPGHGWSTRGPDDNAWPDGQARTLAALLDHLGIDEAIIVGHSFGGAIAASFALDHAERTAGLLFLSPVSHPWPGGVSWYYRLTAVPVLGRLFTETVAMFGAIMRIDGGTDCVFAPNRPTLHYARRTHLPLIFRPGHFRANAIDVANLYEYVTRVSPHYARIQAPAVIITGNKDTIVLPSIHSTGLARDLPNAELLRIRNLGHKPDHVVTDLAIAALERLAGKPRDLEGLAHAAEARLQSDAYGPLERCLDNDVIRKEVEAAGFRLD